MPRFYFFGCQLCSLPHALPCLGFCSTSVILNQLSGGQRSGGQSSTGTELDAARRDFWSCSKRRISESSEATDSFGWSEVLLWDILCRVGLESEYPRKRAEQGFAKCPRSREAPGSGTLEGSGTGGGARLLAGSREAVWRGRGQRASFLSD